jgi:hypothetical protein
MGITENLRRIWLFSANKIKSSESFSKQPTQLIIAAHNCHNSSFAIFLNPNWQETGRIYLPYNFRIGFCQLNFYQKFPNIFGGKN